MGSALSTRYTSTSSDTSSSSANNTPRESRVVVVAKRANSTPNLKSDLNASPSNFPSSTANNAIVSQYHNNVSPTSSMNNVSPTMNNFKFPRQHSTAVVRSSSFTRNLHGVPPSAPTSNNYPSNTNSNINNNYDTASTTSTNQPSIITSSNVKLQAHESLVTILLMLSR